MHVTIWRHNLQELDTLLQLVIGKYVPYCAYQKSTIIDHVLVVILRLIIVILNNLDTERCIYAIILAGFGYGGAICLKIAGDLIYTTG